MVILKRIAYLLIFLAAYIYPQNKSKGQCYIKQLHNGWAIIDDCLIRQAVCLKPLKGLEWEYWILPDKWQTDLKNIQAKGDTWLQKVGSLLRSIKQKRG